MPEALRGPEQALDITLDRIAKQARELRSTYTNDAACVSQAMKGQIADNDPKRHEYFKKILGKMKRQTKTSNAEHKTGPQPQPEAISPKHANAERLALNEAERQRMLEDAAEAEKLHPADALGLEETE